jgi:hypothetical protein
MQQSEYEQKEFLFNKVKNPDNWKMPTIPFNTSNYVEAHAIAEAIIFYVGGAKISKVGVNGKEYTVTSEGYYHYIGA